MTDSDAIRRACAWVGWDTYDSSDGLLFKDCDDPVWRTDQFGNTDTASVPELAEAVRVKCEFGSAFRGNRVVAERNYGRCVDAWGDDGALGFIKAVMEVVGDE